MVCSAWHDHQVATAATAWLAHPSDTVAYARLVAAVERREAFLHPTLPTLPQSPTAQDPEILDEVGADRPPEQVGSLLAGDPRAALARLRGAG